MRTCVLCSDTFTSRRLFDAHSCCRAGHLVYPLHVPTTALLALFAWFVNLRPSCLYKYSHSPAWPTYSNSALSAAEQDTNYAIVKEQLHTQLLQQWVPPQV